MFLYAQNGIIFKGCSTLFSKKGLGLKLGCNYLQLILVIIYPFDVPQSHCVYLLIYGSAPGKKRMLEDGGAVCYPLILPNPVIQGCPARSMNDKIVLQIQYSVHRAWTL